MSNEKLTCAEPISESIRDITGRSKADEEINGLAKFPSENLNPVLRVLSDGKILYHNKASTLLLDFWGCQTTKILPDIYGYDVIKALNELEKSPKIGIITGWGEKLNPQEKEGLKVDFIVKKPFKLSDLTKQISEAFAR